MKHHDRKIRKRRKWAIFDFQYDSDMMDSFVNNGESVGEAKRGESFNFLKLFRKNNK